MIKIDKGVIPGRGPETAIIREMMTTMEIGDSTIINCNNQNRLSSSLVRIPKRANSTIKFKTQKCATGDRFIVWRIK